MKYAAAGACCSFLVLFPAPLSAETGVLEKQARFDECRAILQTLAGAVSGKLAEYSTNTDEVLESTFISEDGTTRFTVTCLAKEEKVIIRHEAIQ
ncbi:hypothetical protein [Hoeflea prorocentri]|uniref:PepSY domain-containing protein n=1 Tax=Hoeflea prorocentri TaxID=1922333 RepID=A0A9X3ZJ02_9HYPH|nr:hypothetical protein [Hoeflea prorocentri]MCY6382528.1 hypothetical protein [Hoeflea prorocentri]MDA5400328.1 hypothetical protein [Hoeflea prorocentri]